MFNKRNKLTRSRFAAFPAKKFPGNPKKVYKDVWQGWDHFLSHTPTPRFIPFKEAREYARSLQLTSYKDWLEHCRTGDKPKNIPANPYAYYDEFRGWYNFLGKVKKRQTYCTPHLNQAAS